MRKYFFKKKCEICKRKNNIGNFYLNDKNNKIFVCDLCIEYAERRAYRRVIK